MIEWRVDSDTAWTDGWLGAYDRNNTAVIIWRQPAHPHKLLMINVWDGGSVWEGDDHEEAKLAAVAQLVLWRMEHGDQTKS